MSIPSDHAKRYLYHFTHLDNLEGVLKSGFFSYNEQQKRSIQHRSIALSSIQERRSRMQVPCGPRGVVHDYVPLYFSKLSPMLLQIVRAKNVDQMLLVHFAFPISILDRDDVIFTDAAANSNTPPEFYDDPANLSELDWTAIDKTKWPKKDDEDKNRRMAEALVHTHLDAQLAQHIIVWNGAVRERVINAYAELGITPPMITCHGYGDTHYFINFRKDLPSDMQDQSIAAGPIATRNAFRRGTNEIMTREGTSTPEFSSVRDLLNAFRQKGLDVLPETRELIDLESANDVHKEDVGTHTLSVVKCMRESENYAKLDEDAQVLVELAAYLHDIGKGPKSRWDSCGGKQQADSAHPLRSVAMLPRILTESVAKPDERTVRILCMLVCYHDLIGDISGQGRNRDQLIGLVQDEEELDMLIALGKADMSSIALSWEGKADREIPTLREWAVQQLNTVVEEEHESDADG